MKIDSITYKKLINEFVNDRKDYELAKRELAKRYDTIQFVGSKFKLIGYLEKLDEADYIHGFIVKVSDDDGEFSYLVYYIIKGVVDVTTKFKVSKPKTRYTIEDTIVDALNLLKKIKRKFKGFKEL